MTSVEALSCNNCGAAIQVPPRVSYVTCAHCGSHLVVRRNDSAAYTEVLERIEDHTEEMAQDLSVIRIQNDLERLDREWQMRRESLMVRGQNRALFKPDAAVGKVGCGIAIVAAILYMAYTWSIGAAPLALFGIPFIGAALIFAQSWISRADRYQQAQQAYAHRRAELLKAMSQQARG